MIRETVGPQALEAAMKGVDLVIDISHAVPEFITGDPTRLAQVISNLVTNAIKFTDQGCVTISATTKEVIRGRKWLGWISRILVLGYRRRNSRRYSKCSPRQTIQ